MTSTPVIRTPDQRLRVFISSTIGELAAERSAARDAIGKLKLSPVFFESGARPHPPQELYRAYLQQSEVFVGIYAASYGWVAPGSDISGIEDEYLLSEGKPRLVYVKNIPQREPRLSDLLSAIQERGAVCYQKFNTAEELSELLQNDLALLLAERFDIASQAPSRPTSAREARAVSAAPLPALHGKSIGRDKELAELRSRIMEPDSALITLTGPGGTGKSRLALHLAHDMYASFEHGCVFVPLAAVSDHGLVAATIARAVGLFDNGKRSVDEMLAEFLMDKSMLLVLDNFEHVLPAATLVSELRDRCPGVRIVATSRAPLRLREERIFPVPPLDARCDAQHDSRAELLQNPAVQLFIQRASEVDPTLDLSEESVRALATLCIRLDGLPLAIELAAARARYLPPVALQSRLDKTLDFLSGGARDLPERQRTMRATISWSHELLDEASRKLFRRLAAFTDHWTLESATAVAGDGADDGDILDAIEKLVDQGLVHRLPWSAGDYQPRFTLLHVVQSFAREQLDLSGESAACAERHALHFTHYAAEQELARTANDFGPHLARLEDAYTDIRAAFWHWISLGRLVDAYRIIGSMRGLWFYSGMVSEAIKWLDAASIDDGDAQAAMPPEVPAGALLTAGLAMLVAGRYGPASDYMARSVALLRVSKNQGDLPRVLAYLGVAQLSMGDRSAFQLVKEAESLGRSRGDYYSTCLALAFQSEAHSLAGNADAAMAAVDEAAVISAQQQIGAARANVLLQRGNLLLMQHKTVEASRDYRESIRIFDAVRMRAVKGWAHCGLAYAHFITGEFQQARGEFALVLELGRGTSDGAMICTGMLGMALIAELDGQAVEGAVLLSAAEETAKTIGYAFWSTDRVLHQDLATRLIAQLSSEEMETARRRGAQMSREEALRLALGIGSPSARRVD